MSMSKCGFRALFVFIGADIMHIYIYSSLRVCTCTHAEHECVYMFRI